jgi:hypothetical protein
MPVGKNITFLVNGYNLACALQSFEVVGEAEVLDATVLCGSSKAYEQGFKEGNVSGSGIWDYNDDGEDKIHEVMSDAFDSGDEVSVMASLGDLEAGAIALIFTATNQKYGINSELGQLIMVDLEMKVVGAIGFGYFMFGAEVPEGEVQGESIDNGAETENGGTFSVQITNEDGADVVVILQHSVDGSVWVDLLETETLSDPVAAVTLTVPGGETVERYTRIVVTGTGGDATSVSAAFARG